MALRDWIPGLGSMTDIRVNNFEKCVQETEGVTLIDTVTQGRTQRITIHIHGESSLGRELIRMVNTSNVQFSDLYVERGETYAEVSVK